MEESIRTLFRFGIPRREFIVAKKIIRFPHDVGQKRTIRAILAEATSCPYFTMNGQAAKIYLDDITCSEEEALSKPKQYVHPWAHLSNLYNLDVLTGAGLG